MNIVSTPPAAGIARLRFSDRSLATDPGEIDLTIPTRPKPIVDVPALLTYAAAGFGMILIVGEIATLWA
jgi:hypothetical protein